MIPTGSAWSTAAWTPTPKDVTDFLAAAKELGCRGANFWSWQHTEKIPALWSAISEFDWRVEGEEPLPDEPEIPEDEMGEVLDKLDEVLANQALILAKLNAQPAPDPDPEPTPQPPAPPPARKYYVRVTAPDRTNARFMYGKNGNGVPIFSIYPSDSSKAAERVQYNNGVTLEVIPVRIQGDSDIDCFELVGRVAGGKQLYAWTKEVEKTW